MKPSLQLRVGQQLTMTPQLQQAIRLLQLSGLELETEIQEALETNPMLEETREAEEGGSESDAGASAESVEAEAGVQPNGEEGLDMERTEIPDELPVDSGWDDVYEPSSGSGSASEPSGREFENRSSGGGLRDHLYWQMELTPFSPTDQVIATAIIDAIDDDGYLSQTTTQIQAGIGGDVDLDEVEAVLRQVQNFDPVGVGARGLSECLLLQLDAMADDTPYLEPAERLTRDHLEALGRRDFARLKRRLKLDDDALKGTIDLIQSLDPRPGARFSTAEPEYIVPDVFVVQRKGGWHVDLNPASIPPVRVNPRYAALVKRADNSPDNTYLKNSLQEARWFLKSLQSRNETLLKVARAIVERQHDFLKRGDEGMRSLVLRDIAEAVGMHESTISRVTTRKYLHTPRGIFELKYFFSSHVGTDDGGECSSTAIRAQIRRLVAEEEPKKPLSDNKIATILSERGIKVARRTVAKYREAMAIPPSNERKRLA